MRPQISEHFKNQVRRKFKGEQVYERCGVIVSVPGWGMHLIELENTHEDPTDHFAMTTKNVAIDYPILGIFHTHLRPEDSGPSQHDLSQIKGLRQVLPRLTGMVYVVPLGLLVEYTDKGPERRFLIRR